MKTRITAVAALRMAYLKKAPSRPVRESGLNLKDRSSNHVRPWIINHDLIQTGKVAC